MSVDMDMDTDPGQEELDVMYDIVLSGYEVSTSGYSRCINGDCVYIF